MKYFEKTSKYKTWDEDFSFTENIAGGTAIGALVGGLSAEAQAALIKRKLRLVEGIKKIKPNTALFGILGGLGGAFLGLGKHFYEQEHYKK
jgi:hypothetical protein